MRSVVVLALPGVVAFDLAVPTQVFGHPAETERYELTVCGVRRGELGTSSGFNVRLHSGPEALDRADVIVVPGYQPMDPPSPAILGRLCAAAARGAQLMSVCTGAFALAPTGLLDGCRVATHWSDAQELADRYPALRVDADALYVVDEPVFTSAGIAAGVDLCIHVVRIHHGEQIAAAVARRMVMAPHRTGGQAQFIPRPVPPVGDGLASTCDWALEHLAEPLSVAVLARHSGWAPRTFARRFLAETGITPQRWLAAHRLQHAKQLLESTDLSVEHVAQASGVGTATNLRLLLARDSSHTPTSYRRLYRGAPRPGLGKLRRTSTSRLPEPLGQGQASGQR